MSYNEEIIDSKYRSNFSTELRCMWSKSRLKQSVGAGRSLESILEEIYETTDCSDNFKEFIKTGLQTTVVSKRNEYYLGKDDIEYEEALASEPIMMPSAYELTLVRKKEGQISKNQRRHQGKCQSAKMGLCRRGP